MTKEEIEELNKQLCIRTDKHVWRWNHSSKVYICWRCGESRCDDGPRGYVTMNDKICNRCMKMYETAEEVAECMKRHDRDKNMTYDKHSTEVTAMFDAWSKLRAGQTVKVLHFGNSWEVSDSLKSIQPVRWHCVDCNIDVLLGEDHYCQVSKLTHNVRA